MGHTPLLAAINKIAKDLGSNPLLALPLEHVTHPTVSILDYRRDEITFRSLWALDDNGVPLTQHGNDLLAKLGNQNLKIILIDTDDATVIAPDRFGKHVAAIDWAYSFYFALALQDKHLPEIAVLDLRNSSLVRSDSSNYNDVDGIRYFDRSYNNIASFSTWLEGISGESNSISPDMGALQSKFRQWTVNLASANSRSGHHDLNNSLGPLSLAASCPDEVKSAVIEARRTLVGGKEDSRQVTAAAALIRAFEWFSPSKQLSLDSVSWAEIFKQARSDDKEEIRILLLDDQAQEGWLPVLAHVLGLPLPVGQIDWDKAANSFEQYTCSSSDKYLPKISLWVASSLSSLIKAMDIPKQSTSGLPPKIRLTNNQQPGAFTEVLFLDLRLFSSNNTNTELNVLDWFKSDLAKKPQSKLTTTASKHYLENLTLPAKALSARDFSYPIVIWSTTGQRSVTQELSDFKNVHTLLQKPRFDHYFEGAQNELTYDVQTALCSSLLVASSRKAVESLAAIPCRLNSIRNRITKGHALVEVYLDETSSYKCVNEKSKFTIGGLMMVYSGDTSQECENIAEQFKNSILGEQVSIDVTTTTSPTGIAGTIECILEGQQNLEESNAKMRTRIGDISDNVYKLAKFDKFLKSENAKKMFIPKNARSIAQAIGKRLPDGSVMIPFVAETPDKIVTPFEHTQIDGKYYEAVPLVLEALLADIIGDINKGVINSVSYVIKVRIASRQKELKADAVGIIHFEDNWATVVKRKDKFLNDKFLYNSVTDAWVHSSLWLICKDRSTSFCNKRLASALADNYSKKMHGLYYLTDIVPTHHDWLPNIFGGLKGVHPLTEDLGDNRLATSIAASRLLDHGKISDAATMAEQAYASGKELNTTDTVSSSVLSRVGERLLAKMDKDSFYRLVRLRS